MIQGATTIGQGFGDIIKGDPLSKITGIATVARGVSEIFADWIRSGDKQQEQFDKLTRRIERLRDAYSRLQGTLQGVAEGTTYQTQQELLKELRNQARMIEQQIESMTNDLNRNKNAPKAFKKAVQDAIEALGDQLLEVNNQIRDILDDISKDIFLTSAEDLSKRMGDALVDAFERGEDAADNLRAVVDDMFKQMIRQAVSAAIFPRINEILNSAIKDMGIDPKTGQPIGSGVTQLTQDQQKRYREQLKEAALTQQAMLDNYRELFQGIIDLDTQRPDGLVGAWQGMTQDTADVLSGQFNAIRVDVSAILTVFKSGQQKVDQKLVYLSNIESNTGKIYDEIKDLNEKVKEGDLRASGL